MKNGVHLVVDQVRRLRDSLALLPKRDVLVGIPSTKASRNSGDPITNPVIGYLMETGVPELNIPARPWLYPGIAAARPAIVKYMRQAGDYAMKGDKAGVDRALHAAGLAATNAVRRKITTGPFMPLAPRTLAARRARGRTGTKPLIDTGQMRAAVTYVIRDKAKH